MTASTPPHLYVIALGSNRRGRHGAPRRELAAAVAEVASKVGRVVDQAPVIDTAPIGPSRRRFANSAILVESALQPDALLKALKDIERSFGRRRGKRWDSRVIDLDLILWSGGCHASRNLIIPHILFRERDFVLRPTAHLVPNWRDPVTGIKIRQLFARLHG